MDNDVYSFALKNALDEIRKACPDITNTFMFKEDGEILVGDKDISQKTMVHVINAFDSILEKASAIGDVECITLEASDGRLNVSRMNDIYLATVTSRKADINYVNTITRVLIPTVLRLIENINPTSIKNNPFSTETEQQPAIELMEKAEKTSLEIAEEKAKEEEPKEKPEAEFMTKAEQLLPEPPVNQLIVENLGGLLVPSDTVRIDNAILSNWEELYDDRKIEEVEIETFDGKAMRYKVKPIKDSKYEGKGIIQMPEKVQLALEIKKGELVRAKPIVE